MSYLGHLNSNINGEKWIKTDTGWQLARNSNDIEANSNSIIDNRNKLKNCSVKDNQVKLKFNLEENVDLDNAYVKCTATGFSTTENTTYPSIGEALERLKLRLALEDPVLYSFIIQILKHLYIESTYFILSGSTRRQLFTLIEHAVEIAKYSNIQEGINVISCIKHATINLTSGYESPYCTMSDKKNIHNIMIKLRLMKVDLEHCLHGFREETTNNQINFSIISLPDDCIIHIIFKIKHPMDIINFGRVNRRFMSLITEIWLWKALVNISFSHLQLVKTRMNLMSLKEIVQLYRKLYINYINAVNENNSKLEICPTCQALYWMNANHPCIIYSRAARPRGVPINAKDFVKLFVK